jgi:hypothetical protein
VAPGDVVWVATNWFTQPSGVSETQISYAICDDALAESLALAQRNDICRRDTAIAAATPPNDGPQGGEFLDATATSPRSLHIARPVRASSCTLTTLSFRPVAKRVGCP